MEGDLLGGLSICDGVAPTAHENCPLGVSEHYSSRLTVF
ncbi:hypothetical protein EDB98_11067 [Pseudomonas fluorescens]|nr:hypothetical protein EDB98_11067 [Pseudomonas fluorescens]